MYSMNRTSALTPRPYSSKSTISSSLSPRVRTVSIFKPVQPDRPHGFDPGEHVRQRVDAGELAEPVAAQGVEAHRDAVKPGALEIGGVIRKQHAVRRQAQIAQPRSARRAADQFRQIAAEQRLAAGEADAIETRFREEIAELTDLLERQHVRARQPDVLVLRHAVVAPEVAAIGDRNPQVAERPAEGVEDGHPSRLWHHGAPVLMEST